MIDIHLHVLPGIDDGPPTWEEAVEMCRIAAEEGVEALVATPHQRTDAWDNREPARLEALRRELADRVGDRPLLLPGAEVRIDAGFLAELADLPGSGVLPLAGSRYLLLELGRQDRTTDVAAIVHEAVVAGWRPILAHPELIPALAEDLRLVRRLADLGATFQVTGMSVTGEFGRIARERAVALLDAGLVHFVASDAHRPTWRPPRLARAWKALVSGWGEDVARALLADNPRAVIENRTLPVAAMAEAG